MNWKIGFEGTKPIQLTFQWDGKSMRELEKCLFEGTSAIQLASRELEKCLFTWKCAICSYVCMGLLGETIYGDLEKSILRSPIRSS